MIQLSKVKPITKGNIALTVGALVALSLAGCANREANPIIEDAAAAVQRAEQDQAVLQYGADELENARDALERARVAYDEGGKNEELVAHEALMATRYSQLAVALGDKARAEEQIDNAELERSQVLLEARAAEAREAEQEARVAQRDARQNAARAESAEAQARSAEALAARRARQADAAAAGAQRLAQQLAELQARETERGLVLTLGDLLFETDRAVLKAGAMSTLDRLAAFLDEYPDREVVIEGHTDSRGTEEYNEALSQRRANAVRDALVDRDIPIERTHTRALGESEPVATNESAAGRQENRRVEVVISDPDGEFATAALSSAATGA